MSTGVIIVLILIVIGAAVVVVAAVPTLRARVPRVPQGGAGLKRRFGPEYERAVARHDGDAKAAERELAERVERHGALRERPLEPAERRRFEARWTAAQEHFVESPREAVSEADRLLAELAGVRGFPDGGQYDEQLAALSVHHADHVHGYRRVHRVARARVGSAQEGAKAAPGTEEMRTAMVEARALFLDLVGTAPKTFAKAAPATAPKAAPEAAPKENGRRPARTAGDDSEQPARTDGAGRLPWAFTRRQTKGN